MKKIDNQLIDIAIDGDSTQDFEAHMLKTQEMPPELEILPIRDDVLFPGVVLPLSISRKTSIQLLEDAHTNKVKIGVITQKTLAEEPTIKGLFSVGVMAEVMQIVKPEPDKYFVILRGIQKFRTEEVFHSNFYFRARVVDLGSDEDGCTDKVLESNVNVLKKNFKRYSKLAKVDNNTILELPSRMSLNTIASRVECGVNDRQKFLECKSYVERCMQVLKKVNESIEYLKMSAAIEQETHSRINRQQKEFFLHQQMQVIQEELGGSSDPELDDLFKQALTTAWGSDVAEVFQRELYKARRMPPASPDYNVTVNYLHLLVELPWGKYTKDNLKIAHARKVLNEDHYGIDKVKNRILEHIAVLKLKKDMKAPILCLVGPPGTGKTSLGKSVARAMGREYVRMALGGVHDESEIRGHRRTYVGAMPGRVIQNIKKAKSANPVFILDEIDKIQTNGHNGDPSSALLEVLDPEQNNTFHDNYLDVDFDLSKVLFIATANNLGDIQPALRDRMEIIDLSGYVLEEKLQIAKKYLIPKQSVEHGFKKGELTFAKGTVEMIINSYTRESGVRQLDKQIASIVRKKAVLMADTGECDLTVTPQYVEESLGLPIHQGGKRAEKAQVGVVTGLAWTSVGGEVLFVEACTSKGKGALTMTGNLGDVMKESATLAHEYIKSHAEDLGIDFSLLENTNIHVHVPEGATPKDGPSAGITMFTAMYSALTGAKVKSQFAMTGEITLRGRVLPVGGIKEKVLAAKRAGITDLVLCEDNRKDIEEIQQEYLKGLEFHYIQEMSEVLPIVTI